MKTSLLFPRVGWGMHVYVCIFFFVKEYCRDTEAGRGGGVSNTTEMKYYFLEIYE